jgi:hypothetical protein
VIKATRIHAPIDASNGVYVQVTIA